MRYNRRVESQELDADAVSWNRRSYYDVATELRDFGRPEQMTVIGIDGHSGSGKSSLACGLASIDNDVAVVHTDDLAWHHSFFDWGDLLIEHILRPLRRGGSAVSFRPPAWTQRQRAGAIEIPAGTRVVIVEGVGSCRREIRPLLDAIAWIHVRPEVGQRRLIAKGLDTDEFRNDWMTQENRFLAEDQTWQYADLWVAGELGQPAPDGKYGNVVTAPGPGRVALQYRRRDPT